MNEHAKDTLRACIREGGFAASASDSGYPQIWARDSMITLLGAALTEDSELLAACKESCSTLRAHQTHLGLVPNNVDTRTGKPNFQAYADSGLWYVIGVSYLHDRTRDDSLLSHLDAIERTMHWYEHLDVHDEGLITIEEGSDWQDLLATRGRGLYVNALEILALELGADLLERGGRDSMSLKWRERAETKREIVNRRFWYDGDGEYFPYLAGSFGTVELTDEGKARLKEATRMHAPEVLAEDRYYVPYFTFRHYGEWFDSFGHLIALLARVPSPIQEEEIHSYIERHGIAKPYPVKAIDPPIAPQGKDWRKYYTFADLNRQHQYHNGGIWPMLGGFYVAVLAGRDRDAALLAFSDLEEANRKGRHGEWEFNEWLHGVTGEPRGVPHQAWSASMHLFAEFALANGNPLTMG